MKKNHKFTCTFCGRKLNKNYEYITYFDCPALDWHSCPIGSSISIYNNEVVEYWFHFRRGNKDYIFSSDRLRSTLIIPIYIDYTSQTQNEDILNIITFDGFYPVFSSQEAIKLFDKLLKMTNFK